MNRIESLADELKHFIEGVHGATRYADEALTELVNISNSLQQEVNELRAILNDWREAFDEGAYMSDLGELGRKTPRQSLAAIKAEAIREFIAKQIKTINQSGTYGSLYSDLLGELDEYANNLEQGEIHE